GVIYMASPDTRLANTLNGILYRLIAGFLDAREIDGFVFMSRFSCKISDYCTPEPDVVYLCPERIHGLQGRHLLGGPDVDVEVVSRDSRQHDYELNRELYEGAGGTEYWIIDPLKNHALFLRLHDEQYEPVPLDNERIFRITVIPGFWFDVQWLF